MTSKQLTEKILNHISDYMHQGGDIGSAFGALKVAKMTLEMSFCNAAQVEMGGKDETEKDL